jgi:hypothetical protein
VGPGSGRSLRGSEREGRIAGSELSTRTGGSWVRIPAGAVAPSPHRPTMAPCPGGPLSQIRSSHSSPIAQARGSEAGRSIVPRLQRGPLSSSETNAGRLGTSRKSEYSGAAGAAAARRRGAARERRRLNITWVSRGTMHCEVLIQADVSITSRRSGACNARCPLPRMWSPRCSRAITATRTRRHAAEMAITCRILVHRDVGPGGGAGPWSRPCRIRLGAPARSRGKRRDSNTASKCDQRCRNTSLETEESWNRKT